jgi:hypothetical protein
VFAEVVLTIFSDTSKVYWAIRRLMSYFNVYSTFSEEQSTPDVVLWDLEPARGVFAGLSRPSLAGHTVQTDFTEQIHSFLRP